jgi:hypothetical protein
MTTSDLHTLFKGLNKIINLLSLQTSIKNIWIESPKDKWRQLGRPPHSWRLYFHTLNQFLSYIYEPHLPSSVYDGFIFNRGCKSWWKDLLWNNYLSKYSNIIEIDFSSGFSNLGLYTLKKALTSDNLLPSNLINLILTHLKSPLVESQFFPTFETYVENLKNIPWRKGNRSVHMGIGISPILFVITVNWVLNNWNYSLTLTYDSKAMLTIEVSILIGKDCWVLSSLSLTDEI